jgi:hypothetical protein
MASPTCPEVAGRHARAAGRRSDFDHSRSIYTGTVQNLPAYYSKANLTKSLRIKN